MISLLTSAGNLTLAAPVDNSGSGGISLLVPQGTFTMSVTPTIRSSVGAITIESFGVMTLGRVISTTGLITLRSLDDGIRTLNLLNFPNVSSQTSPHIHLKKAANIRVDSFSVWAYGPKQPNGLELFRGSSANIDMSIYNFALV